MCWGDKTPKPSESGAGTCPPGSTAPCPLQCPAMEIEINNTPATDDDYVQVKCTHPAHRHRVTCRIRVKNPSPQSTNVVLTNPDGRLRFPDDANTTTTLSVPADGSWASFDISGETGSNALNDAVIQAHCQTATGALLATKTVTVFWFDAAQMKITAGGNYVLAAGRYQVSGAHAVDYSAKATIKPNGVNCSAPQVTNLRIGIMQNDVTRGLGSEIVWGTPTIAWNPGIAAGTTATVPATMHQTSTLPVACNDVAPTVDPLYDQPGKADTLDPSSLQRPIGCTGGGAPATSFDTPSTPTPLTLNVPATDATGNPLGVVTYHFTNARVLGSFITWTVAFNPTTNDFCVLRQCTWNVNVDSAAAGVQKASPAASDAAPSSDPVLAPTANTVVNDPANQNTSAVGASTHVFTHP